MISEWFSTASASVITFILKAIVYKEQCAFGMMGKLITVMKKIEIEIDWNACQVTVTESIVVFLQSHSSIYIFTDSIFFICVYFNSSAFVFSEPFPMFPMRFANSIGQLQSRISLSAYSRWFCFIFWTTQACWKVSNF